MKRTLLPFVGILVLILVVAGLTVYFNPLWVADQQIHQHLRSQHVQSQFVQVDGYTVHYYEAGATNASPIVLVHGLGSRAEDWSPMIPTLAANGFHVYALDLLGYGRTSRPDIKYTIPEQEALVVDFMQATHLTRADLAGWSMGGWVALKLTIDHPALVRRLIVYDSAGTYFPATFDETLFTPTDRAGLEHLQDMLSPHPQHLPDFAVRAALRKLGENAWVIDRGVRSMTSGHDLLDFQLHRIEKPTLLVWGAQDKLIPLEVGESMHKKIPGSSMLIVEGCGHLAPSECSKPILKDSLSFLKAYPAPVAQDQTVAGK